MTSLYQLELDQTAVNCGAIYVIKLEDGRFFIIDGGYFTPGEEDRLYRFLAERSSGTPLIAAWFFSHAHQDHVGNFIQFVRKYRSSVNIERLLYSFHPVDLSDVSGDWRSSDPATIKEFYRTVEELCADIDRPEIKTGDLLVFGELEVEVVYTYEDLFPEPAGFNNYSTVIATTVGGCRILWLADVGRKAAPVLLRNRAALKCDIVQVAHHGIDNYEELRDLYAATEASAALWPVPDYGMVERWGQAVNHFVLYDMNITEHFVSGYGTVELPLPYITGTARKCAKALSLEMQPDGTQGPDGSDPFRYLTPLPVEPIAK